MIDRPPPGDRGMDLPAHPQVDEEGPDPGPTTTSWGTVIAFAVVGVLVAAVVILHLVGGGSPMAH